MPKHFESGVGEVAREDIVHLLIAKISAADKLLDPQSAQRLGLRHAGREDRHFILRLPSADDLLLRLMAAHHERRPALGMHEIDADLRQLRDLGMISFHRAEIAALRMFLDAGVHRNAADAFRQEPNKFHQRSRAISRFHHTDNSSPCSRSHVLSPFSFKSNDERHASRDTQQKTRAICARASSILHPRSSILDSCTAIQLTAPKGK